MGAPLGRVEVSLHFKGVVRARARAKGQKDETVHSWAVHGWLLEGLAVHSVFD